MGFEFDAFHLESMDHHEKLTINGDDTVTKVSKKV